MCSRKLRYDISIVSRRHSGCSILICRLMVPSHSLWGTHSLEFINHLDLNGFDSRGRRVYFMWKHLMNLSLGCVKCVWFALFGDAFHLHTWHGVSFALRRCSTICEKQETKFQGEEKISPHKLCGPTILDLLRWHESLVSWRLEDFLFFLPFWHVWKNSLHGNIKHWACWPSLLEIGRRPNRTNSHQVSLTSK